MEATLFNEYPCHKWQDPPLDTLPRDRGGKGLGIGIGLIRGMSPGVMDWTLGRQFCGMQG